MKTLRPYQQAALTSLWAWLFNPANGDGIVVAPVGAGKSLMIAEFIRTVHDRYPRTRIVMLSHVKELLEQNAIELREQYPSVDMGFYCAGLGQKRLHNDVTFASIQSVHNKIAAFNRCPDILLVDECHLISHKDQTTYRKFINAVKSINPNVKVVGFTGTEYRADTGRLDEGDGKLFDGIAYEVKIAWMIEQGYLVKPFMPKVKTVMNVDAVKSRGGDYIQGELQRAVDIDEITKACVDEIFEFAGDRKRWFGMSAGVLHCEHIRDEIRSRGIDCEMVTGELGKDERKRIIEWFKQPPRDGEPQRALVNVGTLNIGFNAPHIDLLFVMRPTRSKVLYMQFTGRGLRPVYADGFDLSTQHGRLSAISASNKKDVMFLDFGGVVKALGPIDTLTEKKVHVEKEAETREVAPFKICPGCAAQCAPAQKFCYVCSYHFAAHSVEKNLDKKSAIMAADEPIDELKVLNITYQKHWKGGDEEAAKRVMKETGKIIYPSMRVIYTTMRGSFSEYLCFDHPPGNFAKTKAQEWFAKNSPGRTMAESVDQALAVAGVFVDTCEHMGAYWEKRGLKQPCGYLPVYSIGVQKQGEYKTIVSYDYNEPQDSEAESVEDQKQSALLEDMFGDIPF